MSERFEIRLVGIPGLALVERRPRSDARGYLERMFCVEELRPVFGVREISQVNHTMTVRCGTVRGLHFQYPPYAETKIVSCLRGKIFDVAVDVRRDSPTFLRWHGELLSETNHRSLVVPEGFAHGFQTLTDSCEVLYLTTTVYAPSAESALNAIDPAVGVAWPAPISERSERDESHAFVTPTFRGVEL